MQKFFTLQRARSNGVAQPHRMKGLSGKQIALFVGGGFVMMLVIFYLIANWDYIANGFLCFAQDMSGQNTHYHLPMRDGSAYPNCTQSVLGAEGVDGNNN